MIFAKNKTFWRVVLILLIILGVVGLFIMIFLQGSSPVELEELGR
jgi:hypothetical protein